jgi:hypothetical protein
MKVSSRPKIKKDTSAILLRMPSGLLKKIDLKARKHNSSRQKIMIDMIKKAFAHPDIEITVDEEARGPKPKIFRKEN